MRENSSFKVLNTLIVSAAKYKKLYCKVLTLQISKRIFYCFHPDSLRILHKVSVTTNQCLAVTVAFSLHFHIKFRKILETTTGGFGELSSRHL